jgi:thymidylate synthase (FAD)
MTKVDLYDDSVGFIELVDSMGNDYSILRAARTSTGGVAQKGDKEDRGLIRYLWRNQHATPFEMTAFTFHFKVPMFVFNQMIRHRTFSWNVFSKRYSEAMEQFFVPEAMRKQGEKNHQGSGEEFIGQENDTLLAFYTNSCNNALRDYGQLIDGGVSRELARGLLPETIYTEGYFTVDLRNLLHFLELRLHEHAQKEIRDVAQGILQILKSMDQFKWSLEAFEDFTLNKIELTAQERERMKQIYEKLLELDMIDESKDKTILEKIGV